MSLHLQMLQVARLAPRLLGDSSLLVEQFVRSCQNPDGGFRGRTERSDLYYTVFAQDALVSLQAKFEPDLAYLRQFGQGDPLDFVHLCCLARAWGTQIPGAQAQALLSRLEHYRARDGGYNPTPRSEQGTAYGAYLALGAYQDLQTTQPDPSKLVSSLTQLQRQPAGWANEPVIPAPSTNATAAVVAVLHQFEQPLGSDTPRWLLSQAHPQGGFRATPEAPMPDLLSTATALHTLSILQTDIKPVREACLDFVDSVWTNQGGFHGHWADDHLDCEYTFYGLLALGHLAV